MLRGKVRRGRGHGPADSLARDRPDPPWEQVDRVIVKTSSHFEIRSVEIRNTIGGITRFILSEARETSSFPADFFHLEVPRGVKVVREQ